MQCMVLLNLDDDHIGYMIDGFDCLINHYREYNYELEDVIKMAALAVAFQKRRKAAVDNNEEKPKEDPRDVPRPGTHFVYGQGWVDNKDGSNKSS